MPPNDRPRQPAAAARALNRTPLTPKVAAKGAAVASPLARRPQSVTPTVAGAQRDDASTPLGGFLAANVTPRSGTRQNRVESTNSTPSGTPNPDRASDGWEPPRSGLGIVMQVDGAPRHSDLTATESPEMNKFFYASDAKSGQPAQLRQAPMPQKSSTFFYANSVAPDSNRSSTSTPPTNPLVSPSIGNAQDPISSKFFYANGTPDLDPKTYFPNSSSTSVASSAPRIAQAGRSTVGGPSMAGSNGPSRPTSPIKSNSAQSAPVLRPAMSPVSPNASHATTSPPTLAPGPEAGTAPSRGNRRVSIDTPPKLQKGHSAGATIPGNESGNLMKLTLSPNLSEGSPPLLSPGLSQTSMTMASLLHAIDELKDDAKDGDSNYEPQSPTKSQFSDNVSELVANARRERKVQDLEITNASLEAINRTLERQLRKQTAELRRFRRLSRSGRLSLNSAPPSRVVSEALTDPPVDLSDLSEEESEEEGDMDSLEESDVSMSDSGSVGGQSSGAMRRKRDEIRLQLDLTKHQELLIDSQKMNQSIKRCLNWTETLIKEGQKALEYHVRVSDVDFGGRVLSPDDDDDDDDGHDGTAPSDPDATLDASDAKGQPDRDSGIELPQPDGG